MTRVPNSLNKSTIKFLYSYGGKNVPQKTDGKLRYIGSHTKVLAADRSIKFAELVRKFFDTCGYLVKIKGNFPWNDLDVLVSITSDEELAAVMEEYEQVLPESKIRVVLFPLNSLKTVSPVSSFELKRLPCPKRVEAGRGRENSRVPDWNRLFSDLDIHWLNKKELGGR